MIIADIQKHDLSELFPESKCNVYSIYVQINDVQSRAKEMIETISNKSWITALSAVDRVSYAARAQKTVSKLVDDIFSKVSSAVTTEFGEYVISMSAQDALQDKAGHTKVPLAELFKERLSGNSGFDFHTESETNLIAYGEAKYSGNTNPYRAALTQIARFIRDEKDVAELADLSRFVSEVAQEAALEGRKAYVAAFSLNADNPEAIFSSIIKTEYMLPLLCYPELYLIGVEICDTENH